MDHFVGRERELAVLAERLDHASAGALTCVLVEGPGGSGKTALLRAFSSLVTSGEVFCLTGDDAETSLPFGILDQLRRLLIDDRLGTGPARLTADGVPRDPLVEGAALLNQLLSRSVSNPLILMVDDAHLADAQSLASLTFALRRLRCERVMVVLSGRPEWAVQFPSGLTKLLDANGRVSLGGLTSTEIRALAQATGWGQLTERGAERLRCHTDGNPLHLRALMADIGPAQVESERRPLPAPRSFSMLVVASLGERQPGTRRLAAAAAVLGPRTPLHEVALLAGVDDPLAAVHELEQARLAELIEDQRGPLLSLTHSLIRAAVYDHIGAATRHDLHARAAKICPEAESFRHRVAAALGPDPELVRELRSRSATATTQGAWRVAADALLTAVRLSEPSTARDQLLLDAVELLLLDGDLAAATDFVDAVGRLPQSARRLHVQAQIAWLTGRHSEADSLAEAAWTLAVDLDPVSRSDLAAQLSRMSIMRADTEHAALWAERALSLGGLPAATSELTRRTTAMVLAWTGRVDEGLRLLTDVPSDLSASDHAERLSARGILRLWTDDLMGARADLGGSRPSQSEPTPGGADPHRVLASGYLAETEFRIGRWDIARTVALNTVTSVEDTGQVWLTAFAHAMAALVPAGRGEWAVADHHLAAAQTAAAQLGDQPSRVHADNGAVHLAACRSDFAGVLDSSQWLSTTPGAHHEPGFLNWPIYRASALVELGRLGEADDLLCTLTALAEKRGRRSRLAALARVRGELATARRQSTEARAAFEDAFELGMGVSSALETATVHASYGRFLRRQGQRRAAIKCLRSAREKFVELGARPFLQRCDTELAACGVKPESSGAPHQPVLTPQEQLIAQLVCTGLTNREIAARLVLSAKTVGYHLGNVYTKLGIHSRIELAHRMSELAPREED